MTKASRPNTGEIVKAKAKGPLATVNDLLTANRDKLLNACGAALNPAQLTQIALTSIRKNPALLKCDPSSLCAAVLEAAQLGLSVDGALGHAYLVPYRGAATMQIGYRGFIKLILDSGKVEAIEAQVVHEHDEFSFRYGTDRRLDHMPKLKERGEMIAAYAIAYLSGGGWTFIVMNADEIADIRKCSNGANYGGGPWSTATAEMWRKSAVRKLAKYLSQVPLAQRAAIQEEYEEAGLDRPGAIEIAVDVEPAKKAEKSTAPTRVEPAEGKYANENMMARLCSIAKDPEMPAAVVAYVAEEITKAPIIKGHAGKIIGRAKAAYLREHGREYVPPEERKPACECMILDDRGICTNCGTEITGADTAEG